MPIKVSKHNLFLVSLIIFFLIINSKFEYLRGEWRLLETIQLLFLTFGLIVNLIYKKSLSKTYGFHVVNLKILLFSFLIYEEISSITINMFDFLGSINNQSELNIHNANILMKPLISFDLLNKDTINIIPLTILMLGSLLIIGFGSYIKFIERFKYLFLEKRFSIYVLIYPLNLLISYLLRPFISLQNGFLMDQEFIEFFIYLLLFWDNNIKVNISKFSYKR